METRAAKVAACPCKEARSVFNLPPYKKSSGELQVIPRHEIVTVDNVYL